MEKKYKLDRNDKIKVDGVTLYRIIAIRDFSNINAKDKGGYIQSHKNLGHHGDAWVYGNACVYGDAWVLGNAQVYGNACVYGDAWVLGNAQVYGNACVSTGEITA